jgi:hypothetical protein
VVKYNSPIWDYYVEEFNSLPLREQVKRIADVIYEGRDNSKLTLEQQLDILMKSSGFEIMTKHLNKRELDVLRLADTSMKYTNIADELGYANRSSVTQIISSIRNKITKLLEE